MKNVILNSMLLVALSLGFVSCGTENLETTSSSELAATSSDSKRDWDRAFRWGVSRNEKARLIASAVRGIGKSTADTLLRNGYLRYQPRSWTAFKNEMRRASEDRWANLRDVYANTVQKYGSDNSKLFRSTGGGDGNSRGWGCTFDKWRSESARIDCLADAVRGIGNSTARTLIRNNEFRYAPRSWSKFKEYMQILERRYDINDLYYNTVQKYGSDNRRKLY